MKLYLAGPMRGYPEYNFPAFREAAAMLRSYRNAVWSPAEADGEPDDPPKSYSWYMERDLAAVCRQDAIALLPGWEDSHGACMEVVIAVALGKPVYLVDASLAAYWLASSPAVFLKACATLTLRVIGQ